MTNELKAYRFITGPDDAEFCSRVAQALEDGYVLHGNPQHTYNKAEKMMYCGQAVMNPKFVK